MERVLDTLHWTGSGFVAAQLIAPVTLSWKGHASAIMKVNDQDRKGILPVPASGFVAAQFIAHVSPALVMEEGHARAMNCAATKGLWPLVLGPGGWVRLALHQRFQPFPNLNVHFHHCAATKDLLCQST